MGQFLQEVFSPREYLATYYPSNLDVESFLSAIKAVREEMTSYGEVALVKEIIKTTHLSYEVVENAAIFNFLRDVSLDLLKDFPGGQAVLLDVGGGPTLYQHIPLCLNVASIIHGEFLSENRNEVLAYLSGKAGAYSWDAYFSITRELLMKDYPYQYQLRCNLERSETAIRNHSKKIKEVLFSKNNHLFEVLLKRVMKKNVFFCDVFSPSLSAFGDVFLLDFLKKNTEYGLPDIVSAYFLVESATDNRSDWRRGMGHLLGMLKPGGFFIMTAIRHAEWYRVGSEKVAAVPVDERVIGEFLQQHGIIVKKMQVLVGSNTMKHGYDGMVFIFGQKKSI